ncbi:hypothetical protein RRG08_011803 [Elysia crispata]|uniref:Uncharacterized protein n=1 Tax=Elysia crispata TaxID=231223 RepID=A0AAE1DYB7_9GAST|nr:hypothetical protein RRG08_011803 [Elysia crispata]
MHPPNQPNPRLHLPKPAPPGQKSTALTRVQSSEDPPTTRGCQSVGLAVALTWTVSEFCRTEVIRAY